MGVGAAEAGGGRGGAGWTEGGVAGETEAGAEGAVALANVGVAEGAVVGEAEEAHATARGTKGTAVE